MPKLDEQGKPVMDKDGKPLTEVQETQVPAFKIVSVFDVSQTEGEPLPSIGVDELAGNVEQYEDFFKALEQTSPVPMAFEDIPRWFSRLLPPDGKADRHTGEHE